MITYEKANGAAVQRIAANLRKADKTEVRLASGKDPATMVYESYRTAHLVWTASINGIPECVFGVNPHPEQGVGMPWMVGTNAIHRHQVALVRDAKRYVAEMQSHYDMLVNFVHSENTSSIRWLSALGFFFRHPMILGPFAATFIPFYRQSNV